MNPATSTNTLKDGLTVGSEAISRSALEHDIRLLIVGYQKVSYFSSTRLLEVKLGVLYGLYLLFYTQPDTFDKVRIRLSLKMWKSLFELYQYCQKHNIYDAEYIYEKMRADDAFEFVAVIDPCGEYGNITQGKGSKRIIPNYITEIKDELSTGSLGEFECPESLNCLDQIINQYHLKKRKISETEEAKAASRKITRNKMNSRTEDQLVDIWSIVAPLNASDEKIVDNLKGKLEQIKKERLEYLTKVDEAIYMNYNEDDNEEEKVVPNVSEKDTAFDVRNRIRTQNYQNNNRQFVPFALRATLKAMEKDTLARSFSINAPPPPSKALSSLGRDIR
ncbi:21984_t:CDS:2 [Cetraspora pellucida]|uniref:21984_t:CDS:1 n=1 Tax=Cetraspora pellucida TaxID=1433469 RepID=A0A9N9ASN5_9GLOM|nr:21984_t:CDS:2 [Cetraspora pellucida]